LKAPSAKNLRNKLGIFNVTTKISWKTDAPRRLVVAISLKRPNNLETPVHPETFFKDSNNLEFLTDNP
jgi:hypothetical protein